MMTEFEWDELKDVLASLEEVCSPLPTDAIHGVLTALAMADAAVSIEALLPIVLGQSAPLMMGATTRIEVERLAALLKTLRAHIDVQRDDPDFLFAPVVRMYPEEDGERADGSVWCAGFVLGLGWAREAWAPLMALPDMEKQLWSIGRLAAANDEVQVDVSACLPWPFPNQPLSRLHCEALTEQLPFILEAIQEQITDHQTVEVLSAMKRGDEPPAWRTDDPCPCGSGKDFTLCCGAKRVLH